MLVGLLLVLGMMARLQQPETHRAIGRALGEPAVTAPAAPPTDTPPLVPPAAFAEVRDNAPFRSDEQAAWFDCFAAVQRSEPGGLAGSSVGVVGYAELTSQPQTYRGRVVTVGGRVLRIDAVQPAPNEIGVTQLWRVTLEPTGGEVWPITVYTLEEPAPLGDPDEPYDASAVGVFFKKLSYRWADGIGSTPVVVARRLETTLAPREVAPAIDAEAVTESDASFAKPASGSLGRALLEEIGYDLKSFESVVDQRPLRPQESEAFYALLGAVQQTPATQLVRLARLGLDDYVQRRVDSAGETLRDRQVVSALEHERGGRRYSVTPLFGDGAAERGELLVFDAVVRRAVRVDASGSDAAKASGVDHYYELEAFPEDSQNLPLVFVVRELPAGFPVGDAIRQPVRLAGFFFKQWAYRSRHRAESGDRRQFAPLLVGRAPIPLATPDAAASRPGLLLGALGAAGLALVVAALWRLGRKDREFETATLARLRRSGDSATLDFERLSELIDHSPR